ncbi:hypothetical protein OIU85_028658 [Salix viminalis]|uniref:peroxidase n=1 Tax=Salix viminalis TaxID=40686 RepID=A0A9Q0QKY8_SALVM|nr:hypothetical protein OIU85_028658 [Salix viminalis]
MASFKSSSSSLTAFKFHLGLFLLLAGCASAQLSTNFYGTSCPNVLSVIKSAVGSAVSNEARMGASLLRLHFHDCFVNASYLPFFIITSLGGPSWQVRLGRRDSATAGSVSDVNNNVPSPALNVSGLISSFSNKGFTAKEMVALSGSHTIGQARCTTFLPRINNENNIDSSFKASTQAQCQDTTSFVPLDVTSPTSFDNAYYRNLLNQKGLLHSDQQLFSGGSTDAQVRAYSSNQASFRTDFANAMIKMGNLSPLTGTNGQIRTNCRKAN